MGSLLLRKKGGRYSLLPCENMGGCLAHRPRLANVADNRKGVVVAIWPDEMMPVDEHGNRAECIMDGNATNNRMNFGRLYEHYINAASRDAVRRIRQRLGIEGEDRNIYKQLHQIEDQNPGLIDEMWNYVMGFYEICSPRNHTVFASGQYRNNRLVHLTHILKEGIMHLSMPTNNQPEPTNIVRLLEKKQQLDMDYRPLHAPVRYVGNSGIPCVTVAPVRIAPLYVMILEKTGDDWSAISSGKLQHHGVLAKISSGDKYAKPSRVTPVRAVGESELRIYISYCGPRLAADIMDKNNNPITHKHMVENILMADKPTAIEKIVDRNLIPFGGSKPLQIIHHIGMTGGWKFVYDAPIPISQPKAYQ